jgi:phosphatidylethanolamine N-methyltransferase
MVKSYNFPANLSEFENLVPFKSQSFQYAVISIFAAPLIWNILARLCRLITKGKSERFRYVTCYILALWIFSFSTFRDVLFHRALEGVPVLKPLIDPANQLYVHAVAAVLVGLGQVFVWSSFFRLGITGTFLGDYCYILMDKRVTGFPFNVLDNPMYVGSSLSFLGSSLYQGSLAGVVLTALVFVVYQIALLFEGPYTAKIYAEREQQRAAKKK